MTKMNKIGLYNRPLYMLQFLAFFIPLDIMIGKMLTPKIVVSLEYEYGIVYTVYKYKQYKDQIEFRIGYFY